MTAIPITLTHLEDAGQAMDGVSLRDQAASIGLDEAAVERAAKFMLSSNMAEMDDDVAAILAPAAGYAFTAGLFLGVKAARLADAEAFDR